jgi:hypothetical protein
MAMAMAMGKLPAAPTTTPAIFPASILEGAIVCVTIIPDPVDSVDTPGTLPVLVTLVIIEVARVGLLSSAAAAGCVETGAMLETPELFANVKEDDP